MINLKKTVMAVLACTMLLALPLTAGAASMFTTFPNITGLKVNGSKVTFVNMSGLVKSMNVTITTIDDSTGMKHIEQKSYLNGREISPFYITPQDLVTPAGVPPLAESGHFVTLEDLIVFDGADLGVMGTLIAPTGNMATGPVQFQLSIPGGSPPNGAMDFISGAAEASVNVTNPTKNTGVLRLSNFQPRSYAKITFTTISGVKTFVSQAIPADIKVTVTSIKNTFFLSTSIEP